VLKDALSRELAEEEKRHKNAVEIITEKAKEEETLHYAQGK
jgi:hypothetical protein